MERDLERVRHVREGLGDRIDIMVDTMTVALAQVKSGKARAWAAAVCGSNKGLLKNRAAVRQEARSKVFKRIIFLKKAMHPR